jgi:uncharacterized protein YjdB
LGGNSVCIGNTLELNGSGTAATTNPWKSSNINVATISNLGMLSPVSSGTTTITYTDINSCIATRSISVNVNPTISGGSSVCKDATIQLTGSATAATSNAWVSSDPSVATISNTGVVTGLSAGSSTITYTNSNVCSVTKSITVNSLPIITGGSSVCVNATLDLTGNGTAATTNAWTSSNTAVATVSNSGVVTGVSAGTATITYTNNNSCSITTLITVNALPTVSGNVVLCVNTPSQLTGSPTAATTNPWTSSNTSVATTTSAGLINALAKGTSIVTYRNSLGCSNTVTVTVTDPINPTFNQVSAICSGANLSALPTTSNNSVTGTWSPSLNNTATTTYTFTPSSGQCANTATMTITVNPLTTPTFTQVQAICSGGTLSALPTTSTTVSLEHGLHP